MPIKVIAIGNRLMSDDGVAVRVGEELEKNLTKHGVEVVIGETDVDYCLSNMTAGDFIVVLDATCFGIAPGTVTVNSLGVLSNLKVSNSLYSQHGYSLIEAISMGAQEEAVEGVFIGIEGQCFDFGLSLSTVLEKSFKKICDEVEKNISFFETTAYYSSVIT